MKYKMKSACLGVNPRLENLCVLLSSDDTALRCGPGATGSTLRSTPAREDTAHETHVVPPDAIHRTARRLPRAEPLGVGRHPFVAVRSEACASDVQRLHGRVGIRGGVRL